MGGGSPQVTVTPPVPVGAKSMYLETPSDPGRIKGPVEAVCRRIQPAVECPSRENTGI